jgi:hypothetical protein
MTNLQERVLLLGLQLVGTENAETAGGLLAGKTILRRLEEREDVVDDNGLQVDLLLVVQVLSLKLDLENATCQRHGRNDTRAETNLRHVDLGV